MDMSDVGNRIKELRIRKGWTQNRLATEAGISPTYIYQLESGQKSPTIEYLSHICFALGVTLGEFFDDGTKAERRVENLSEEQKRLLEEFLKSL